MSRRNSMMTHTAGGFLLTAALTLSVPLQASETGAFIGGVFATKLLGNMERRTQAEQVQAYNSSRREAQPVHAAAPAAAPAPAAMSPQQKLDQLDKLAAGGYITPDQYKARRKAILDAM